jgi:hypothetical protein
VQLEYRYLEKMVHEGKRQQLWNVIPQSIYTPQEYDAYVQRLTKSLSSRSHLGRLLARMQLVRLGVLPDGRLTKPDRMQLVRLGVPTAAIIDSQSAKTTEAGGPRGYDCHSTAPQSLKVLR